MSILLDLSNFRIPKMCKKHVHPARLSSSADMPVHRYDKSSGFRRYCLRPYAVRHLQTAIFVIISEPHASVNQRSSGFRPPLRRLPVTVLSPIPLHTIRRDSPICIPKVDPLLRPGISLGPSGISMSDQSFCSAAAIFAFVSLRIASRSSRKTGDHATASSAYVMLS